MKDESSMTAANSATSIEVYAVFLIGGGRLGDIHGRKFVFLFGLAGFAMASAFSGFRWIGSFCAMKYLVRKRDILSEFNDMSRATPAHPC